MTDQFNKFLRVFDAFEKEKVDYVLVGGVAVILYGMQRLTRDIDIFVKMDSQNIARLRRALHSVFNDSSIEEITYDELQRFPVIRYGTPNGFCIDILSQLGDVATYDDLESGSIDFENIKIRIATPETLYRLKKDTVRPEDKLDAKFLEEIIKNSDIE